MTDLYLVEDFSSSHDICFRRKCGVGDLRGGEKCPEEKDILDILEEKRKGH